MAKKSTSPKAKDLIEKTETDLVHVHFTESEKTKMTDELCSKMLQRRTILDEKAEVVAGYNSDIKKLEKELAVLVDKITAGSELREQEVTVIYDFIKNVVQKVTKDGVVCLERTMTAKERQLSIDNVVTLTK